MDYQEAQNIRKKSFGTMLAEQEGGLGTSLKKTIGLKTKARVTGLKQKFDPMNIAKFMTFGSNWAPAMLGKATGRKQQDMNFFTGAKKKGEKAEQLKDTKNTADKIKQPKTSGGFDNTLEKIYALMNKSFEDERKRREEANNFKEENELEKLKRHKELIEAVTGKPYSGKATATKVPNSTNGSSMLEMLLGGRALVGTLMSVLSWFASPVGLALLGAASLVALIALIAYGLKQLAENTPNGKALSPDEAQAILQNGNAKDIEAMGGRAKLEDIIKNGKTNAQAVLDMPETTEEEKEAKKKAMLAMGGEDKVKAIAADGKVYEVPPQRSDADLGIKETVPSKAEFVAGKPGTGGAKLARGVRATAWDEKYGKDYNEDGTRKTATPVPAPAATTESAPAEAPGGAGGASPAPASSATPSAGGADGGSSTAIPTEGTPASAALPALSNQNADLQVASSAPDASTTVNSSAVSSTGSDASPKSPIAPVRNLEASFRNMIIGSTRTV